MGLPPTHIHRVVNPEDVLAVWALYDELKGRKTPSLSAERLLSNLSKQLKKSETAVNELFDELVADGLLKSFTTSESVGTTASAITIQQGSRNQRITYCLPDFSQTPPQHLPEESPLFQNHDWYCFECHKAGEVINCTDCFRVFHVSCIKECQDKSISADTSTSHWMPTTAPWGSLHSPGMNDDFVCHVCQSRPKCEFSRKQIRKLLDFATFNIRKQDNWKVKFSRYGFNGDICKCEYVTYRYVDTDLLHNKIFDGRYMSLEEFLIDLQVLIHDVCLLFGPFSSEADDARFMGRTIEKEIQEAKLCTDCYINGKAKPADWISKPCKPPHDLIWCINPSAQSMNAPYQNDAERYYWPAKVLLEKDSAFEVRFFGGLHERRLVPRRSTLSFDMSSNDVPVKRGAAFDRAWNEVTKLRENVNDGYYTHSSGESDLPPSDDDYSDEMYLHPRRIKLLQRHYSGGHSFATKGSSMLNRLNEEGSITSAHTPSGRLLPHVGSPRSSISSNLPSRNISSKSKNETTASILNRLNSGASSSMDYHNQTYSETGGKNKQTAAKRKAVRKKAGVLNGSALSSSSESSVVSDSIQQPKKRVLASRRGVSARGATRKTTGPGFYNNRSSSEDEDLPPSHTVLHSSSESLSSGLSSSGDDTATRNNTAPFPWRNSNNKAKPVKKNDRPPTKRTSNKTPTVERNVVKKSAKKVPNKSANSKPNDVKLDVRKTTTSASAAAPRYRDHQLLPSSSTSLSSSSDEDSNQPLASTRAAANRLASSSAVARTTQELSSLSDSENSEVFTQKSSRLQTRKNTQTTTTRAAASKDVRQVKSNLKQASITKKPVSLSQKRVVTKKGGANAKTVAAKRQKRASGTSSPSKSSLSSPSQQLKIHLPPHAAEEDGELSYTSISESENTDRCSLGDTNGFHPLLYVQQRSVSSISPLSPLHPFKLIPKCDSQTQTLPLPVEPPKIEYREIACKCAEKYELQLKEALAAEQAKTQRLLEEQRIQLEQEKTAMVDKLMADTRQENIDALENLRRQLEQESTESINGAKRRQWCRNCLREAIYHCCWNTAYCSINCQQEHWQKEHKRACRRKR